MDSRGGAKNSGRLKGSGKSAQPMVRVVDKREKPDAERRPLLAPRAANGGMARNGRKGVKRKVQWNDCHGKNLVEVLEFYPSDSSDSDDEYLDACLCAVM